MFLQKYTKSLAYNSVLRNFVKKDLVEASEYRNFVKNSTPIHFTN